MTVIDPYKPWGHTILCDNAIKRVHEYVSDAGGTHCDFEELVARCRRAYVDGAHVTKVAAIGTDMITLARKSDGDVGAYVDKE